MFCRTFDEQLLPERFGEKAAGLAAMTRAGVPVPRGFAIDSRAHELRADDVARAALRDEIALALEALSSTEVMVRSSAVGEDSADASFAGQLSSYRSLRRLDDVMAALERCWDSYDAESLRVYAGARGAELRGMGVAIQELVDPDHAGVLFTRAPDDSSRMLCEYVAGHGEALVSGAVDPYRLTIARTETPSPNGNPFDIAELRRIALWLEAIEDRPLDIEWVSARGRLWIVQRRPITIAASEGSIRWSNTNVNENYPGPITPLLYSIARESYYHYFKNLSRLLQVPESAVRELEPAYANIIGAFGCRMYYNMTSIHTVIGRSPFAALLRGAFDDFVGYRQGEAAAGGERRVATALRFLRRFIALDLRLTASVEEFERRADEFSEACASARTFSELRSCFHAFIEIRMHSWYRASLADFFAMVYHGVIGVLCRRWFGDDAVGVQNRLVQAIPDLVSSTPVVLLWEIASRIRADEGAMALFESASSDEVLERLATDERFAAIRSAVDDYLHHWGFRCSGELMLTEESFSDAPAKLIDLLRGYVAAPGDDPAAIIAAKASERERAMKGLRWRLLRRRGLLAPLGLADIVMLEAAVRLSFHGIASRERVRLKQALLYHRFKGLVARIGRELASRGVIESPDDALYLRHQELAELLATSEMLPGALRETIAARRVEHASERLRRYPDDFSTRVGERASPETVILPRSAQDDGDSITGLSACGGTVRGPVRVLESVMEMGRIRKGDILVTRQTDPGWATIFPLISGLIVERGGMLSHGAIVAREFGIPAVVGVARATEILTDGEIVELDGERGEVKRQKATGNSEELVTGSDVVVVE